MKIEIITRTGDKSKYDNVIEDSLIEEINGCIHKLTFKFIDRRYGVRHSQVFKEQITLNENNIAYISITKP